MEFLVTTKMLHPLPQVNTTLWRPQRMITSHRDFFLAKSLQKELHRLTIVVEDDGHGLAHDVAWNHLAESRHYGLLGMRERSRRLDGDCRIAAHGRMGGVSVRIRVPLPQKGMGSGD